MHRLRTSPWISITILVIAVLVISGCAAFEDPSVRATENANSTAISNTVSAVEQQQETVSALQATADSAVLLESQVTQISAERNKLQSTLTALQTSGGAALSQPTSIAPGPASTPSTIDGGAPAGPGPSPTPPAGNAQARYVNPQIASSLTDSFCAANNQTTVSMGADVIYFVAIAQNIRPGVQYSLRITEGGQIRNLDTNFWTSDDNYESTCIYYGIDENNIPFEAGTYTAELLANNEPVAQANFTIN